ncbi:hypothetical protein AZ78_1518 [Lysobacter capsici AZ78]|uniref:Uncharacterized protein n=1 Tax=Lysobacter capsici AZ78 TaxID=1444315 RepID=A0A108U7H4_9GAMM|nr:hypothetical protein AZ78_1518 [Lysobacter capsici AZ78]
MRWCDRFYFGSTGRGKGRWGGAANSGGETVAACRCHGRLL